MHGYLGVRSDGKDQILSDVFPHASILGMCKKEMTEISHTQSPNDLCLRWDMIDSHSKNFQINCMKVSLTE